MRFILKIEVLVTLAEVYMNFLGNWYFQRKSNETLGLWQDSELIRLSVPQVVIDNQNSKHMLSA